MASGKGDIPKRFDVAFLEWFRARSEAAWAALPERTPQEVLAEFVRAQVGGSHWQHGTRWLGGLSEDEVAAVERRWRLTFPPDYQLFLRHLHSVARPMLRAHYLTGESREAATARGALATAYVRQHKQYMVLENGPSFYNWLTDADALEARFAWLWEGLQFDVEHNDLWRPSWGARPAALNAQKVHVRELVEAAPRLIPVYGHRYLLAEPCAAGNPVLSIYQSDIVVYGTDLRGYLLFEFADLLGLDQQMANAHEQAELARRKDRLQAYLAIPFWGELLSI